MKKLKRMFRKIERNHETKLEPTEKMPIDWNEILGTALRPEKLDFEKFKDELAFWEFMSEHAPLIEFQFRVWKLKRAIAETQPFKFILKLLK